jgi:hypothetical protein
MDNVKFIRRRSKFKVKVRNYGTNRRNTYMIYEFREISFTIQKTWPISKFVKSRSNFKVKARMSKIMEPVKRSCHKKQVHEIRKPYHLPLKKNMDNVKSLKSRSYFNVVMVHVPIERSCRKEHTYEIPIAYHSKYMLKYKKHRLNFKVKVSKTMVPKGIHI